MAAVVAAAALHNCLYIHEDSLRRSVAVAGGAGASWDGNSSSHSIAKLLHFDPLKQSQETARDFVALCEGIRPNTATAEQQQSLLAAQVGVALSNYIQVHPQPSKGGTASCYSLPVVISFPATLLETVSPAPGLGTRGFMHVCSGSLALTPVGSLQDSIPLLLLLLLLLCTSADGD